MYFRKVLPAVIFFSISVIYYSCDSVTSPTSTLSGKIYGYNYLPASNVKVTIKDQSAHTSDDGSFTFTNVAFPYDIIVSDSSERYATVFKGLSAENIFLALDRYVSDPGSAFIIVSIPKKIIQTNLLGKIIFTDGNFVNQCTSINSYDTTTLIDMNLNAPVTGKLIVLTYKRDNNGKIISYENYGESPDIQIRPEGNYNYQFDSLDLTLNPGEQNVTGSFRIPFGSFSSYSDFYLSFTTKNTYYSDCSWFSLLGSNNFNILIPSGLPRQFKTIVRNNTYFGDEGNSLEDFIAYPNVQNNFDVKSAPHLISPDNNIKNVNNNTQFSFNSGTGNGVYIIQLHNSSRNVDYKIVTSNLNFTLGGLEDLGFGRINNNYFSWSVRKIGPANSMNDYVTNFFDKPDNFISESQPRFFSTEP